MVDVSYYQGDQFMRMNNDMGMYYQQQMYPFRTDSFNCPSYLPQGAMTQRYHSPLHLTNVPTHNYVSESPTLQYIPPCTPMSQNSYCMDQPDSPRDISPFQTPPQNMCYYSNSSDTYSSTNPLNLQSDLDTSLLQNTPCKSESIDSEELNHDDMKDMMNKQILAILEQQGPTANGKRKRIKKGTLTETQKVYLRRERNRVAATKCREKRKQQSSVTKLKYDEYSEKNQEIRKDIERLEKLKEHLKRVLESHPCIKAQQITSQ